MSDNGRTSFLDLVNETLATHEKTLSELVDKFNAILNRLTIVDELLLGELTDICDDCHFVYECRDKCPAFTRLKKLARDI